MNISFAGNRKKDKKEFASIFFSFCRKCHTIREMMSHIHTYMNHEYDDMLSTHSLATSMTDIIWFQIKLITILAITVFTLWVAFNPKWHNQPPFAKKTGCDSVTASHKLIEFKRVSLMNGLLLRWHCENNWDRITNLEGKNRSLSSCY